MIVPSPHVHIRNRACIAAITLSLLPALVLAQPTPRDVRVVAPDGLELVGTFYRTLRRGAPGVVMFHQCSPVAGRQDYQQLARLVQISGINVLAVDSRALGESTSPEWTLASLDEAARRILLREHYPRDAQTALDWLATHEYVDSTHLAVLGASCGTIQALYLAESDNRILALVAMSSLTREADTIVTRRADLAVLGIGSMNDSIRGTSAGPREWATAMHAWIDRSSHVRSRAVTFTSAGHGTSMLREEPELHVTIALWLREALGVPADDFHPKFSPVSDRIVFDSNLEGYRKIYTIGADGSDLHRLTDGHYQDSHPSWSPDGRKIVFESSRHGDLEVFTMNADGSDQQRLTESEGMDAVATWSPDGGRIAFASDRDGDVDIYVMDADGSNIRQLTDAPGADNVPEWSPDGRWLSFNSSRDGDNEIYIVPPSGGPPVQLTDHPANDFLATWAPDGSRVAFFSTRSGRAELYTIRPDGSGLEQITYDSPGSGVPSWSRDGRYITIFSVRDGNAEVYVIGSDGSSPRRVTSQ